MQTLEMDETIRHAQDTCHAEVDILHKDVDKLQSSIKDLKKENDTLHTKIVSISLLCVESMLNIHIVMRQEGMVLELEQKQRLLVKAEVPVGAIITSLTYLIQLPLLNSCHTAGRSIPRG